MSKDFENKDRRREIKYYYKKLKLFIYKGSSTSITGARVKTLLKQSVYSTRILYQIY